MIQIDKKQLKEIKKIVSRVYTLADKIDDLQKKTLMYCDELKDLTDQVEPVFDGQEEQWKDITKQLKMKTRKAFEEAGRSSKYDKWDGNL